jgi:hypothetical protein
LLIHQPLATLRFHGIGDDLHALHSNHKALSWISYVSHTAVAWFTVPADC